MSELSYSPEQKPTPNATEAMEVVANNGAYAIHNFLPLHQLQRVARVLEGEQMEMDDNPHREKVDRHHELVKYGFSPDYPWPVAAAGADFAPEPLFNAARKVSDFVTSAPHADWRPNEIMGHRYNPGDFIAKHRDYASALGYVAVLTVKGSQEFFFEQDDGELGRVAMQPGTLTIMRGNQLDNDKPRPYHWVAPALEQRLAISLRQLRIQW